jgi:hypothetical protein
MKPKMKPIPIDNYHFKYLLCLLTAKSVRYTKYFKILKYAMKEMKNEKYTIHQHLHNFAVWTSSRAVQRCFTSTKNIANAIESSGLRNFVETFNGIGKAEFENFHIKCAQKITTTLKKENCTYGIAAKIIAVYLKTSLVIYSKGMNCENIHPPLDRILLTNFKKCNGLKNYIYKPWTQLDKKAYWKLISLIEKQEGNVSWEIEKFWKPFK